MRYSFLLLNAVATLARCTHIGHWRRALYFTCFAASTRDGFLLGDFFSEIIAWFHPDRWEWSFYLSTICLAAPMLVSWFILPSNANLSDFYSGDEPEPEPADTKLQDELTK